MWFELEERDADLIKKALNHYKGLARGYGHPRINVVADKLIWSRGHEYIPEKPRVVDHYEPQPEWGNMSQGYIESRELIRNGVVTESVKYDPPSGNPESWGKGGFGKLTPEELDNNVQDRQHKLSKIFRFNSSN